jgi:hypothetical protein
MIGYLYCPDMFACDLKTTHARMEAGSQQHQHLYVALIITREEHSWSRCF